MPSGQVRGDTRHARSPLGSGVPSPCLVGASAVSWAPAPPVALSALPVAAAPGVPPSPCLLASLALVAPAGGPQSQAPPRYPVGTLGRFCPGDVRVRPRRRPRNRDPAPAAYGSGGASLPGLVTSHPTGLGPKGTFLHDSRPGLVFASAVFVKGPLWGEAYSNVHVAAEAVLTLGRYVYSHLPPGRAQLEACQARK